MWRFSSHKKSGTLTMHGCSGNVQGVGRLLQAGAHFLTCQLLISAYSYVGADTVAPI
jgi:hypothetical protein